MNIPEKVDVLVIGAGTGGWPAAVGAARSGASVLLVEEDERAGGAPVDNYITMPCGDYITGVYAELISALEERHRLPVAKHGPIPDLWSRWFMPCSFAVEIQRIIRAESNIQFLPGVRVEEPLTETEGRDQRVVGAVIPRGQQKKKVRAHVVIDATGTGSFAVRAGAEARYGTESKEEFGEPHAPAEGSNAVQQCTLMFISQRLGEGKFDFESHGLTSGVDPEFGWLKRDYRVAMERNCGIYLTWGGTVECADTRDPAAVADAHSEALTQLRPEIESLHANHHMVQVAPKIGVRESRRVVGEETLTESYLREGVMPEDTVAIGNWFLDDWGGELSESERKVSPYGIPLRSLLPRGTRGLAMACRAISISHLAFSSWRVQPTVASAGQAAGVAAALAAEEGGDIRDLPFASIRKELSGPRHAFDIFEERDA